MQLSNNILNDIQGFGQRVTLQREGSEKRGAPRFPFFRTISVPRAGSPSPLTVMLRDISATGVSFNCESKMTVGEEFTLNLPRLSGEPAVRAKCIVNRCEPGGSGKTQYSVGAAFQQFSDDPLLAATGGKTH